MVPAATGDISERSRFSFGIVRDIFGHAMSGVIVALVAYYSISQKISDLPKQIFDEADRRYVTKDISEARYQTAVLQTSSSIVILQHDVEQMRHQIDEISHKLETK